MCIRVNLDLRFLGFWGKLRKIEGYLQKFEFEVETELTLGMEFNLDSTVET